MTITNFTEAHTAQAMRLAQATYEQERTHVPALPDMQVPALHHFEKNNLGVAAFEGEEMLGYLCALGPQKRVFGTTKIKGVWSPVHAHAAVGDKARLYHRMYQTAAEKWVNAGALSHAVTLYAHDEEAKQAWFTYGFGIRCIDAVKLLDANISMPEGDFLELPRGKAGEFAEQLCTLNNLQTDHMGSSPCFMRGSHENKRETAARIAKLNRRMFAAQQGSQITALMTVREEGETFASNAPDMLNIGGVIALPEVRGTGLYANLLRYAEAVLAQEGYARLGVDYESFNPNALYFYPKHFTVYANSLVRRIDERGNR